MPDTQISDEMVEKAARAVRAARREQHNHHVKAYRAHWRRYWRDFHRRRRSNFIGLNPW